jgi:hypothetical protein
MSKYTMTTVPEESEQLEGVDGDTEISVAAIQEKMAQLVQDAGEIFTSAVIKTVRVVSAYQIPGAREGLTFQLVVGDLWDTFMMMCLRAPHLECHNRNLVMFQVAMYTAAACLSRSELINVFLQVRRMLRAYSSR